MRPLRPYATTILALLAGIAAMRFAGNVTYEQETGVRPDLPAAVGPWRGELELFCQKATCGRGYSISQLAAVTNCIACGGPLGTKAAVEAELLPPDTYVRHMSYTAPGRAPLTVILVISGIHRTSIHRPELCFAGHIAASRPAQFEIPGRAPLDVRLLTLRNGAGEAAGRTFFAYWFVAKDRETSSHSERILSMASARIFHGINRRWAYVTVSGHITPGSEAHLDELRAFLRDFVPQLAPR